MPNGSDARRRRSSSGYADDEPDEDWQSGSEDADWVTTPDVEALIAAHRGTVLAPPPPPRSPQSQWWLGVLGVCVVGAGVVAAIVFAPKLYHDVSKDASGSSKPTSSSVHGSTTPSAPATSSTAAPPDGIALKPNANGVVYIATKSGRTQCDIAEQLVRCYSQFANSPMIKGHHATEASVTTAGTLSWDAREAIPQPGEVTLDYKTYQAQGWTIAATVDGTRFTNNKTVHGMSVAISKVESF